MCPAGGSGSRTCGAPAPPPPGSRGGGGRNTGVQRPVCAAGVVVGRATGSALPAQPSAQSCETDSVPSQHSTLSLFHSFTLSLFHSDSQPSETQTVRVGWVSSSNWDEGC
eukprot:498398-Prorocentrum_minimum.AAC.1